MFVFKKSIIFTYIIIFILFLQTEAQTTYFIEKKPLKGEGTYAFLRRYMLDDNSCNLTKFLSVNNIDKNTQLLFEKSYKLPVYIYNYNGKNIRSTINNSDYDLALRIKEYNEKLLKNNLRKTHYTKSNLLWVPYSELYCNDNISNVEEIEQKTKALKTITENLFGEEYKEVTVSDETLKNRVFYIVSGHGGPDSGARYKGTNHTFCEDEYAYDVCLRLARNLMQHSAIVHIIIKDRNDGIRDEKYLACDKDEKSYYNKELPRKQLERLKQRSDDVNGLYKKHKKSGVKSQVLVSIHVDSRSLNKRQDVFFYHHSYSTSGKKTALSVHNTFEKKYRKVQKGRAYHGTVSDRDLYILSNTLPTAIFIELGNIRNTNNQKRLILSDNRQALANWIYLGLANALL